jgi:hypothetical protein
MGGWERQVMKSECHVIDEMADLYRVYALTVLRRTKGVAFDAVPTSIFPHIDAIDRVIHGHGAISPGSVGEVERPWYRHTHQDDNLLVLHGTRYVEIYTPEHGRIENFTVTADRVEKNGELLVDGPAILVWPRGVFHRIRSCEVDGSASVNLAVHYEGFDIRTNFSVYDLDPETGESRVAREGHWDQPS